MAQRGVPVALPSTKDAFEAVPKIAIIATAVVERFDALSSLNSLA